MALYQMKDRIAPFSKEARDGQNSTFLSTMLVVAAGGVAAGVHYGLQQFGPTAVWIGAAVVWGLMVATILGLRGVEGTFKVS